MTARCDVCGCTDLDERTDYILALRAQLAAVTAERDAARKFGSWWHALSGNYRDEANRAVAAERVVEAARACRDIWTRDTLGALDEALAVYDAVKGGGE